MSAHQVVLALDGRAYMHKLHARAASSSSCPPCQSVEQHPDAVPHSALQKHGHTHIDELAQHANRFQNEAILLMHFSARYSRDQVVKLLDEKLPPELHSKCTPMLEGW